MKTNTNTILLRLAFSVVLIAAVLVLSACGGGLGNTPTGAKIIEKQELGSGATTIVFSVVDAKNEATVFTIHTDKTNLREALEEHDLIAGDKSAYGLYVKTVNGITADYESDGAYWALWEGTAMSNYGVDSLTVTEGGEYAFVWTAAS